MPTHEAAGGQTMWERAAIIAVGDEVLTGEVVNTNGSWMARELIRAGSRPLLQQCVGDDVEAITAAIRRALDAVDLVVLIGGLGPTPDDLTRLGAARALGRGIHRDPEVMAYIRARHRQGAGHEASIAQQSEIVDGAEVLLNPVGTAPGQLIRTGPQDRQAVALLPGPPGECRGVGALLLEQVRRATGRQVVRATWHCYDLTESELAHYLRPILTGLHPRAGLYTRPGVIDLRLEAEADAEATGLPPVVARAAAEAQALVPVPLYDDTWPIAPERLLGALRERGETLAVAESVSGGRLAAELTAVPGASDVLAEGVVVYTDAAKIRLGVPAGLLTEHGPVSQPVAEALAEAVRRRAGTDWGVGLTGWAGPGGGDEREPVGTYYCAVAGPDGVATKRRRTRMAREVVQQAAAETARFMLATRIHPHP